MCNFPGGGYLTNFYTGRLRPEVRPLTLSYTSTCEIPTLFYTWSLKKVSLSGGASPYRPLQERASNRFIYYCILETTSGFKFQIISSLTQSWGVRFTYKYSCSSAISTLAGKENKRRLQTLSIDNAWSNKNFLVYLTFRMLQHTSSEVNGYNCYKHLKIQK